MLLTSKIIQSIIDSFITVSGESVAEHPKINKILKILEPIALPKAKPLSPFFVATIEVTSSGREVPIATIVSPMKFSLTPKFLAIIQAWSTTCCPPKITKANPKTINRILVNRERVFVLSSFCFLFYKIKFSNTLELSLSM